MNKTDSHHGDTESTEERGEKNIFARAWQWFWREVWIASESLYIPLGPFAPWVFEQMIGIKGEKISDE